MRTATVIELRVSANAKRSEIVGRYAEGWKVRVAAPREDGKANAELLRVLADVLMVSVRQIHVVSGGTSADKVVAIEGVSRDVVVATLAEAATGKHLQRPRSSGREKRK